MVKLTKKQTKFLNDFKNLYGICLLEFVEDWRTSRKYFTVLTGGLDENVIASFQRFCQARLARTEINGYSALAVFI